MEEGLWRLDAVGGASAEAARGREHPAPPARRGPEPRQGDADRGHPKKALAPARCREMIDFVKTVFGVSVRRACRAVPAPRSTYHYAPRRPPQDVLRKRIRELAETHVRYGYRRIHILLRREGWEISVTIRRRPRTGLSAFPRGLWVWSAWEPISLRDG